MEYGANLFTPLHLVANLQVSGMRGLTLYALPYRAF